MLPPPLWMRVGTWEEELCEFLFLIVLSKLSVQCRVARPVTEHLVSKRSTNFWRVLLWIPCPKRNCSPTICAPTESWIVEKDEEMSQMWPSKVGGGLGVKWWKQNTTAQFKDYYQTPQKVFESRSIAFMVERWFVDHKVALLFHFKSLKLNKKWESYEHWK